MQTSRGNWIVVPATDKAIEGVYLHSILSGDELVALSPNMADAALIATAPQMLDTLIAIHETLNASKTVIDLVRLNELVSEVFEKIAAESGES